MRLRLVAAAAAVAFAPAAARAQAQLPGAVLRTYDLAGCGEGPVPGVPGPQPAAVCATGYGVLDVPDGAGPRYRFQLFLTFRPDARQAAPSYTADGAALRVRYVFPRCREADCGVVDHGLTPESAPLPEAPQQLAFTAFTQPTPLFVGLPEPLEARFHVLYAVPGDVGRTGATVIVRFTATPEPSAALLVAAGGVVLAGAVMRSRRR